jgi:peptide/nickel transport system permease protein
MLGLVARRIASMILIMIVISVMLFVFFEGDKLNLAMRVLGQYSTMEGRLQWLEDNGYNRSLLVRYFSWLYGFITGDWKTSAQFSAPVYDFLLPRLKNTTILGGCVFLVTVSISLVLGDILGDRRGEPARPRDHDPLGTHHLGPGFRIGYLPCRHFRLLA